jgi:hypothetical protein
MFNGNRGQDGSYDGSTGARMNEGSVGNVELRLDPSSIKGLEDFQPGDKVTLTIEARMGEPDEEGGMTSLDVTHVEAEPMDHAFKSTRRMMGKKPNMAGTSMEGMEG